MHVGSTPLVLLHLRLVMQVVTEHKLNHTTCRIKGQRLGKCGAIIYIICRHKSHGNKKDKINILT